MLSVTRPIQSILHLVLWFSSCFFSLVGRQQGNPIGPLLFCNTVQPLLNSMESVLTLGFLNDLHLEHRRIQDFTMEGVHVVGAVPETLEDGSPPVGSTFF